MVKRTGPKLFLAFLAIGLAVGLNYYAAGHAEITEEIYSGRIYRNFSQVLSRITGLYSYSLAEIIVVFLAGCLLWGLIKGLKKLARSAGRKVFQPWPALAKLFLACGIIYFLFIVMWGLNYNRLSMDVILGLEIRPASVEELTKAAEDLLREVNGLRSQVQEDQEGVMYTPGGYRRVLDRAALGYQAVAPRIPELAGQYGPPKPVALSRPWSYTGIWGVYFPFTAEANVNIAIPAPYLPFTAAQEMAHQRGFAREDEAHYIAYLVCRSHPDAEFRYSGNLMGLVHLMRALAQADPQAYQEMVGRLSDGVKRDILALEKFNEQHENPLETLSQKINNLYLKANRQKDGIQSYGRMVDLLLAEYRARMKEGC